MSFGISAQALVPNSDIKPGPQNQSTQHICWFLSMDGMARLRPHKLATVCSMTSKQGSQEKKKKKSPLSHYLDLRIMSVYLDFCNTDYVMKQRKGF